MKASQIILIIIVVIVVIGAILYGSNYSYQTSLQPRMTLTDITPHDAHFIWLCLLGYQTVGADFTIVNTGTADGFATVRVAGGGATIGENIYLVPAGQMVSKSIMGNVNCSAAFTVSVAIVSVQKS